MIKPLAFLALAGTSLASHAANFDIAARSAETVFIQIRKPCAEPGCGVIVQPRPRPCVLSYCPEPTPWPYPFPKPEPEPYPECPPRAICVDLRIVQMNRVLTAAQSPYVLNYR